MAETRINIAPVDPVWDRITKEAREAVRDEPLMGGLIHACILHHKTLEKALSYRIAAKLSSNEMSMVILREIADQAYEEAPELVDAARADLVAVYERDPACHRLLQPILYFKVIRPCRPIASDIGCGRGGNGTWPISSRCGSRRSSESTFTRRRGSARAS